MPNTGTAVSTFTLAVDKGLSREKKSEMELKNQPTADFINCVAFGKVAEFLANYNQKGSLIAVEGKIQTRSYQGEWQFKVLGIGEFKRKYFKLVEGGQALATKLQTTEDLHQWYRREFKI